MSSEYDKLNILESQLKRAHQELIMAQAKVEKAKADVTYQLALIRAKENF